MRKCDTTGQRAPDTLTRRELEVLVLMVNGLTDRAIADSLVISRTTVRFHVQHVLHKL